MSLAACLPGLEADGKITADQAAEARALYDELLADYAASGSRESAEALASAAVVDQLERTVARKDFLAGLTVKRRQAILKDMMLYGTDIGDARFKAQEAGGNGKAIDPRAGRALISGRDPRAHYSSVEGRRLAIVGDAHRELDRLMAEHSADLIGRVRKKAQLDDIVRELFGKDTGNGSAKALAEAWRRTAEKLRQRFNAAGGDIGFRADWGLPQAHDWAKVRKAGYPAWRAAIWDRLDRTKMVDERTGKPFSDEALELVLNDVFETIRSDGTHSMTPGAPGGKALANRRADGRFLAFKDADSWMAYQKEFGTADPYAAMMGHVDGMARDIAALEVLGPNPEMTLRWVKDTLAQSAGRDRSPGADGVSDAKAAGRAIDRLWDEYRGAHNAADKEWLALTFSGLRSWEVATKLGGAMLTAVSDFGFQRSRRKFNGLSNAMMVPQYLKLMRPGSAEAQKMAVRRGLIAEEWAHRTAGQNRLFMEEMTGAIPRSLANFVLRASGLNRHTQSMRWVYGMETLATYTEAAGKGFAELEPELRSALARYGLDAADWDKLRSAPMDRDGGVEWISPHNAKDPQLAARFMEMVHGEKDLAVPVADLETRATFNSMLPKGTWRGELGRSMVQFKSFGLSVMLAQTREILAMSTGTAASYTAGLVIGTTLMGGVAIQLKALANGQDLRPMDDPPRLRNREGEWAPSGGFWGAAMFQGGGLGIAGDFFYSAESRTGQGFGTWLAGPLLGDAQRVTNTASAKDPRKSVVRTAKGFVPGNNIWYSRTAFDRLVADRIDEAINPDIRNARRRQQRYADELGTDFWWSPGDRAPDRNPDFANALEEGPEQ
jgi:hypothetical protein